MSREAQKPKIIGRTIGGLIGAWKHICFGGRRADGLQLSPYFHAHESATIQQHIHVCLSGKGGDCSANIRVAQLGESYLHFDDEGRRKMLTMMAQDFKPDPNAINTAAEQLLATDDKKQREKIQAQLRNLLELPIGRLLRRFNSLPQGTTFLVNMRSDLLRFRPSTPLIAPLEEELRSQLAELFAPGALELRRITWDSPAAQLEKLAIYEAAHKISRLAELKSRLMSNHRCYAFFHPRMANEPLIFVWVALNADIPRSTAEILKQEADSDNKPPKAAVFYSISNTQPGLQGINLGNFLVKRVMDELNISDPSVKTFSTLSPVMGFKEFLRDNLPLEIGISLSESEYKRLKESAPEESPLELIASGRWLNNEQTCAAAEKPVMRLCAHYLTREYRSGENALLNSNAHFHLSNGARIERINWCGDLSSQNREQCYGLMVNYVYERASIEQNHEMYTQNAEVCRSNSVNQLLNAA